jgi:hypothetical protein
MSESFDNYPEARAAAIAKVRRFRSPVGIERTKPFGRTAFSVFFLPKKEHRFGFELRCEALEPEAYPPRHVPRPKLKPR